MRSFSSSRVSRARAFALVEVLIAVLILAVACVPILLMASQGLDSARLDRARMEVESICLNVLQLYGRPADNLVCYLAPSADDPRKLVSDRLHLQLAHLYETPPHSGLRSLSDRYGLEVRVELRTGVANGLDEIVCRATWYPDRQRQRSPESVAYSKFMVHEHR